MSKFFTKVNEHKMKLEGHGLDPNVNNNDPFAGIVKDKKTYNKYHGDKQLAKTETQKLKNKWRHDNKEKANKANKRQQSKRNLKIRYLIEKYGDEIGLSVKKYDIFNDDGKTIKDETIKEILEKIKNGEN